MGPVSVCCMRSTAKDRLARSPVVYDLKNETGNRSNRSQSAVCKEEAIRASTRRAPTPRPPHNVSVHPGDTPTRPTRRPFCFGGEGETPKKKGPQRGGGAPPPSTPAAIPASTISPISRPQPVSPKTRKSLNE